MELEIGQKVDIVIEKETDLGYIVLIEGSLDEETEESLEGLIYRNEVYTELDEGYETVAYVKNLREDGKIDLSLQPIGYRNTIDNDKEKILFKLDKNNGVLNFTDKSTPESIKFHLQMSKKAFKRALGALYKEKKVKINSDSIEKI
jgi:predicted RNA-binding protein (virulence factor B family)